MSLAQTATVCHHSKEPFDALFACIRTHPGLSLTARVVYSRLVTQHRLLRQGKDAHWTQQDIADSLLIKRTQVWNALEELKAAELVVTIRHGQGRPNEYILYGVASEDLDGTAGPGRQQNAGQPATPRARTFFREKKDREEVISTRKCYGCGGPHRSMACPKYPGAFRG